MNKHLIKGDKMNAEEMKADACLSGEARRTAGLPKPWASLMGALLICASAQVAAQVCEAERQQVIVASQGRVNLEIGEVMTFLHQNVREQGEYRLGYCVASSAALCEAYGSGTKPIPTPTSPEYGDLLRLASERQLYKNSFDRDPSTIAQRRLFACVARHMAGQTKSTSVASVPGNPSPNSPQPATARPSPDARGADQLALNAATALAQKRQSDVDRARQGKPKRHVAGLEAHNCLKPQPGGGVTNACPYAVEYSYCVYHPEKDSWSASFDCEKAKFGLSVIGPGPNSRSTLHTAGEATYWFACKYGETVPKPDGVSPADIEFQRGRGLLGRCAEWGAKRG